MIFLLNFTQFDAIIANFETHFAYFETKIPDRCGRGASLYSPIHDVAPSAVRIADAIDAINCTINLVVSFLLIFTSFLFYPFTFLLLI